LLFDKNGPRHPIAVLEQASIVHGDARALTVNPGVALGNARRGGGRPMAGGAAGPSHGFGQRQPRGCAHVNHLDRAIRWAWNLVAIAVFSLEEPVEGADGAG
jgi:hypothetical protein